MYPATSGLLRSLALLFCGLLMAACSASPSGQADNSGQQAAPPVPDETGSTAAVPESALAEQLRPRFLFSYASW